MIMCINDYLTSDLSIYCTRYSSVIDIQGYLLQYRFYPFNTDDTAEPISIVRTRSVIFNFNGKKEWSHRWYLKAISCDLIRHTVIADRLR